MSASLTEEEVREHAERLIRVHNDQYEFSDVYEDEEIEDADLGQDEWRRIHSAMYAAKLTVTWEVE